jgi:hypothetical protein
MGNTIFQSVKGLIVAVVVLAIPTFAVIALANSTNRAGVEIAAEHDPLTGLRVVDPVEGRQVARRFDANGVEEVDLRTWTFTWGKGGKPSTSPGK